MVALALVLGIITLFLIFFLNQEIRKNKKLEKENDGLRHLALQSEINLNTLIKSGLPIETIASYMAYRIEFMIETNASIKSVLDLCDELFITNEVVIPAGTQSNIDKVRIRIQEIIIQRFNYEKIESWINSTKLTEKELEQVSRLNNSFFRKIKKSMLVADLKL